jgi:heat shock protein HslJ
VETVFPDGNKTMPEGEQPFVVVFTLDNKLNAQTDCNTFMGSYETSAPNNISIIANASTLMACEGAQEPEFMEALGRASTFSIENDQLTLVLSDSSQMNFQ